MPPPNATKSASMSRPFHPTSTRRAAARSIRSTWERCTRLARISARAERRLPINRRPIRAVLCYNRKIQRMQERSDEEAGGHYRRNRYRGFVGRGFINTARRGADGCGRDADSITENHADPSVRRRLERGDCDRERILPREPALSCSDLER